MNLKLKSKVERYKFFYFFWLFFFNPKKIDNIYNK